VAAQGAPFAESALLEAVPDGVLLCDARGRILLANRRLAEMTGYTRAELATASVELLVPEGLRARHRIDRQSYQRRPRRRQMGSIDHQFQLRRKDSSTFPADIALGPVDSRQGRLVMAVVRDITERVKLEAQLEHQALHDPLTGLANRTLFFDRLNLALQQALRDRKQVAIVMLDLDQFKLVNDAHGHEAGDQVMRRIAARLGAGLRRTDTVARIGGDEFAMVLPNVGGRQAAMVMLAKLLRAVPARIAVGRKWIEVGVSAGIALYPDDGGDLDTLMRVADVEMYAAKRHAPHRHSRTRA
jgi:diguanylate cyclase (GGDEF)-like protein/PAS domain S-box-containing protein